MQGDPYAALAQLGLELPPRPAPGSNYCAAKTAGNIVFLAGVISQDASGVIDGTAGGIAIPYLAEPGI